MIDVGCASYEAASGPKRCGVGRLWGEVVQPEHKRPSCLALRTKMDVLTSTPNLHSCARDRSRLANRPSLLARTCCSAVLFPSPLPSSGSHRCTPGCVHRLYILSHHYLKMAALRFTVLFVLLLGVALLTAPHQVTAAAPTGLCYTNMTMCLDRYLRCRECFVKCMEVFHQLKGFRGRAAFLFAARCEKYVR